MKLEHITYLAPRNKKELDELEELAFDYFEQKYGKDITVVSDATKENGLVKVIFTAYRGEKCKN